MQTSEKGFQQSDATSFESIAGDVKGRCGGNPEKEFDAYKIHLDAIVTKRKTVIRRELEGDATLEPEVVNDSTALSLLIDERFREKSSGDVEVTGLVSLMRSARGEMVAIAAAEENKRALELRKSQLQNNLNSLKDFRYNLDRLGLDTATEDADIAGLDQQIAQLG